MEDELEFLEKIDQIRYRTDLDFESARALLEAAEGSIVEALSLYEASQTSGSGQFMERVKEMVTKANRTRIVIKGERETVAELPVTAGVVGALLAPKLVLVSAAACLFGRCSVQLRKQGAESDRTD